ncbi:hypothetical protein PPYR_14249 [Photinus pyralis]|uniref:Uncharacterized protein n=1 Tax=Photinus pyralis TaxID=7054 RepID=A0A5N4A4P3_PHOPY|nr:hypothetical protein PPYR_14249 [Photinus pyralis]
MHRVLFLCSLLGIGYVNMFTLTNFVISTLENCDPNNASEMFLRVTKTSGRQYLDFSINFKSPFDEKIGVSWTEWFSVLYLFLFSVYHVHQFLCGWGALYQTIRHPRQVRVQRRE